MLTDFFGCSFTRSIGSGNRWGQVVLSEQAKQVFSGDICVPEGFKWVIECKGGYEDDMHLIIMINWRDNPWHGELEAQRVWDFENRSRAEYDHIWEGAFND